MSDKLEEFLDEKIREIGEHFDTVQVLVSNFDPVEGTTWVCRGHGNWFTRLQLCHDFLRAEQNHNLAVEVAKEIRSLDEG